MGGINGLLGWLDSKRRTIARNVADAVENPGDWAAMLPYELADRFKEIGTDPIRNLGPSKVGMGMAGILRKGGDPSLVATHQMGLNRLLPWAENGRLPKDVYSPSIGINKGAITQDFSDNAGMVTLVARPDALDPIRSGGKLYNRDAFTPRYSDYAGSPAENVTRNANALQAEASKPASPMAAWATPADIRRNYLRGEANARLLDRFAPLTDHSEGLPKFRSRVPQSEDLRLREGDGTMLAAPRYAEWVQAIKSSPTFRSFAEFEASPRGAALLTNNTDLPKTATDTARRLLEKRLMAGATQPREVVNPAARSVMETTWKSGRSPGEVVNQSTDWWKMPGAEEVIQANREYRKRLAHAPSEYAEMKMNGPVGLHSDNWAGAIIRRDSADEAKINALKALFEARGIPVRFSDGEAAQMGAWARELSEQGLR